MSRFITVVQRSPRYDEDDLSLVVDTAAGNEDARPHIVATATSSKTAERLAALLTNHADEWDTPEPGGDPGVPF